MLPPADSASCWTTAARSEGLATNRFIVSPVRPNRTRYFATTTTPRCKDAELIWPCRLVSRTLSPASTRAPRLALAYDSGLATLAGGHVTMGSTSVDGSKGAPRDRAPGDAGRGELGMTVEAGAAM